MVTKSVACVARTFFVLVIQLTRVIEDFRQRNGDSVGAAETKLTVRVLSSRRNYRVPDRNCRKDRGSRTTTNTRIMNQETTKAPGYKIFIQLYVIRHVIIMSKRTCSQKVIEGNPLLRKLYENQYVFAFLDINPAQRGTRYSSPNIFSVDRPT